MIDISKGRYWDDGVQFQTHSEFLARFNTRKPKVFAIWNDLFHKDVTINFIHHTFWAMYANPQNTYLIPTKRPERMVMFKVWNSFVQYPPDYIFNGLTVCNQQEADEKIPVFQRVPGNTFLSIEPMLTEIDLRLTDDYDPIGGLRTNGDMINAVILGGETGPGARPMHPDWVRSVRDQCAASGIPFFFRQWGTVSPKYDRKLLADLYKAGYRRDDKRTGGRLLDGRTHDDLPWNLKRQ